MSSLFDPFSEPSKSFASFEEATEYLDRACIRFGVHHLSYWCVAYSGGIPDQVSWIATYPPEYMNQYMGKYTPIGDPAFEQTMTGPLVSDWTDVINSATVNSIHDLAAKYGITRRGLSIPIRDEGVSDVLFSANVECDDAEWLLQRVQLSNCIHMMAYYYHRRVSPLIRARSIGSTAAAA